MGRACELLNLLQIVHLGVADIFLFQQSIDARPEDHRVETLGQEVLSPELDRLDRTPGVIERGNHDDRYVPQRRIRFHRPQDIETVHLGHHDIEEDSIDRIGPHILKALAAASYRMTLVAERGCGGCQLEPHGARIIDDQYPSLPAHGISPFISAPI